MNKEISIPKYNLVIIDNVAVISTDEDGWRKELNVVSWKNHMPKYEIRRYSPDYTKIGRGITFTAKEMQKLKDILNEIPKF